ncbi:UDP-glucosyltransferase 2-like isoform X2 [Sitodiplosis mosellana]|uniref:UDP-glucosyltransferase 2-like isoform X2 n=1 Tax=Sitodiplosis mosellana TaxID=263140 RepID=UPI002444AF26|nr:UDP-glucosyltransferase 2-like isoform X2 [Sitodiplosis mosellana]
MKLQLLAILCTLATTVHGYRILVLAPINRNSHWNYMQVFVNELLTQGHEVTCITSIKLSGPKHEKYIEILIDPPYNMQNIIKDEDIYKVVHYSPFAVVDAFRSFANASLDYALADKNVKKFIHRTDLHFDLVINEDIYYDALLMFGHKFKAPIVTICPYGIPDFFDHEMGLLTPLSHVSHTLLTYTDQMNFFQRWHNTILSGYDWFLRRFYHVPLQTNLLKKHFGHLKPLPSIDELRKNISVIFANAHRAITHPRPSMPSLIYIGGAHIKPPKSLPSDIQQFLDEANDGVIFFSLGSVVNASKMPKAKLNVFLETFSQLKQRVIWKFEDESIENLPENVIVRKWLPQNDLLAHPKVILFITHGGMLSNFEAVHYGTQVLVIPFAFDQYRNALRAQSAGYGKYLDFNEITKESFSGVLNELLSNKQYSIKAKETAAIFRKNPINPMDEFIWWVEYVIKFQGAKHLKSTAVDMSLFTYLLLDVLFANLVLLSILAYVPYFVYQKVLLMKKFLEMKEKEQ